MKNDDELEIVRFALAMHLNAPPDVIGESLALDEDLGLDPLDLVLVVLRLEELGDIEFPIADLEGIRTVGDLTDLVRAWGRTAPDTRVAPTLPPAPTESGFHRVSEVRSVGGAERRSA